MLKELNPYSDFDEAAEKLAEHPEVEAGRKQAEIFMGWRISMIRRVLQDLMQVLRDPHRQHPGRLICQVDEGYVDISLQGDRIQIKRFDKEMRDQVDCVLRLKRVGKVESVTGMSYNDIGANTTTMVDLETFDQNDPLQIKAIDLIYSIMIDLAIDLKDQLLIEQFSRGARRLSK